MSKGSASNAKKMPSKRESRAIIKKDNEFPYPPVPIQTVKCLRGVMNHSYRDFSQVPPTAGYNPTHRIQDMTFAQKIHAILSNAKFATAISWMPHGRAFKVHVPKEFETNVLPIYFGHHRYSSFLRDLNKHSFKHISKGIDRNCYYHEYMLRGRPHLCQYMPRCKDARRLEADPANEPDFYKISDKYPVEEQATLTVRKPTALQPPTSSSLVSSSTSSVAPSPSPLLEPPSSPSRASPMEQLLSVVQAVQEKQPPRKPVPPTVTSLPLPPSQPSAALASSLVGTATDSTVPALVQLLLATNGGNTTVSVPPTKEDTLKQLAAFLPAMNQQQPNTNTINVMSAMNQVPTHESTAEYPKHEK